MASIMGFLLCLGIILLGVATNGGIGTILNFIHLPSALITFGGAFLSVLASADSFSDYWKGLTGFFRAFQKPKATADEIGEQILTLSGIARREGLLSLEEQTATLENEFLRKGIRLMVDGTDPELVRDILETDLVHKEAENQNMIQFWEDLGAMGPAWGMVGTLLGLINMMLSMQGSPDSVGQGMGMALITTLYGSVLANWICAPIARKMRKNNEKELFLMELTVEGILSVQAGENPQIIKEKIRSFMKKQEELADMAA